MPRFRDSLRWVVLLSATLTALTTSAADEPATTEPTPAPIPAERPKLPPRSDTMAADLLRQLPNSEFVNLKAGSKDFIALWRPANVGEPKGIIILLPGEGETADWPRGIGPLRRGLPDYGWHTLSLSLPDSPNLIPLAGAKEPTKPPAEPAEAEPPQPTDEQTPSEAGYLPEETAALPDESLTDDAATGEPTEPPPAEATQTEQIAERIEAALAFARSKQPATIVFLGHGTGSYWAARYLQQLAPADVRRLLVIQPRQPEGQDEPLARLVPALKLATGDFYYKDDIGQRSAARERLNASRRNKHPAYLQVGLQRLTGDSKIEQEQLLRRIRGWLAKQT
ncbi:alpha/beta hydrolase family protein [Pseudomonas sp. KSR10]|uniref:alpha/beta hydrolase family protein n=1 Tax=Pseudomonas sp. KSR10 TaxID=2916654 RepID=UPI001EF8A4E7|nr:alpha/beta hydrolase family protein [Pseudomonas sp. KSR10]MCG6539561.1 alpha/beta hydrolase family protein [Pseudomonas sp. KSR10]